MIDALKECVEVIGQRCWGCANSNAPPEPDPMVVEILETLGIDQSQLLDMYATFTRLKQTEEEVEETI